MEDTPFIVDKIMLQYGRILSIYPIMYEELSWRIRMGENRADVSYTSDKRICISGLLIYVIGMIACVFAKLVLQDVYRITCAIIFITIILFSIVMIKIKGDEDELKNRSILIYSGVMKLVFLFAITFENRLYSEEAINMDDNPLLFVAYIMATVSTTIEINMFIKNKKSSVLKKYIMGVSLLMYFLGVLLTNSFWVLQYTFNIIGISTSTIVFILFLFIGIFTIFCRRYKVVDDDEVAEKNKLLLEFAMVVEVVVLMGFIIEMRFESITPGAFYVVILAETVYYCTNMIVFFKNEKRRSFKYLVIGEFVIGYMLFAILVSNWIFFISLPMIVVCTIYGEEKYLILSGVTLNLATVYSVICKMRMLKGGERPEYYVMIYIVVLLTYAIFTICIIRTSKMIGTVNSKKYNEMTIKKVETQELSGEVVNTGKQIRDEAYSIEKVTEEIEDLVNNSLGLFDRIGQENYDNARSANVQTEMTCNIVDMINGVTNRVNNINDSTNNSYVSLARSQDAVKKLKDKSNHIINRNKDVIEAIEEFTRNIKELKELIYCIENISEETDLLALNASIESSRVKEFRKDFELVALEVRNLSEAINTMVEDMSKQIMQLENNTLYAKRIIDKEVTEVIQENEIIDETVKEFQNMDNNLGGLRYNIANISEKFGKVVKYSGKIERHSNELVKSSNIVKDRTNEAVILNKRNKDKTVSAKKLMDDLINSVEQLNEYI